MINPQLLQELNKIKVRLNIKKNLNSVFDRIYSKLAEYIFVKKNSLSHPLIVGISGGQGSGKTTFVEFLKKILELKYNLRCYSISIDDIYKTKRERFLLSKRKHKLFVTRGVPGTHDTKYLINYFKNLEDLKAGNKIFTIPKFNKAIDDRMSKKHWYRFSNKCDIILFEGWCVGATDENNKSILVKPINNLEKVEDRQCVWRKLVNNHLKKDYKILYSFIDFMIYLKAPSFKKVLEWRTLQEKKLSKFKKEKNLIMNNSQLKRFVMFYERITQHMFQHMPKSADIVIPINFQHQPMNVTLK